MARSSKKESTIPPRDATDRYFERLGRSLDYVFDIDLGELIRGHRVVLRGIELQADMSTLHYEFVPGLIAREQDKHGAFFWYWIVYASDDVGTAYDESNNGAFDDQSGGAASHGDRDLGGSIPAGAGRLTLRFEPPTGWAPPEPWVRRLEIDLTARPVRVIPTTR